MRKSILFIAALLAVIACNPEEIGESSGEFKFSVEGESDPAPCENGSIAVFRSQTMEQYDFVRKDGKQLVFSLFGKAGTASAYPKIYAVMPYSLDMKSPNADMVSLNVPVRQKYVKGGYDKSLDIRATITDDPVSSDNVMYGVTGRMILNLYGKGRIRKVILSGNNGERIAGKMLLSGDPGQTPAIKMAGDASTSVELDFGEVIEFGGDASASVPVTFVIAPTSFTKGFKLTFEDAEGTRTMTSYSAQLSVSRGKSSQPLRIKVDDNSGYGTSFSSFRVSLPDGKKFDAVDLMGPTITLCVPRGTPLNSLKPEFDITGAAVKVNGVEQKSGVSAQDFTSPRSYVITSKAGKTATYKVKVIDIDIPVIYISTPKHQDITSKDEWIKESRFKVLEPDGTITDYDTTSVKGRGNATWTRPNKSYSVKFADKPEEQGLLGMRGHKRWCLLAVQWGCFGHLMGYELGRRTAAIEWEPSGRYVELVLNGEHRGTYVLVEQIKVNNHRVNVDKDEGYLITYDQTYNDPVKFRSQYFNMPVMIKHPDDDVITQSQIDYLRNYINNMEASMKDDARFKKREYAQYLDVDTYIDVYFVWETAGKIGSGDWCDFADPNSVWFYKDKDGPIKSGPCWDADSYLFTNNGKLYCNEGQYYGRLFKDPVFLARAKEKWPEFRKNVEHPSQGKDIIQYLDSLHNVVKYSAERNYKMWSFAKRYEENWEYQTIREGLPKKLEWLEKQIMSWK